jgi:branched-chain amino acid transport system substrate-binding protein
VAFSAGSPLSPAFRLSFASCGLTLKPIKLGLTCDASGQFGNSGQDDLRGMRMAIDEYNAKGGLFDRKIVWVTADTESQPATGSRVAERFIAREDCTIRTRSLLSPTR